MKEFIAALRRTADEMERGEWSEPSEGMIVFRDKEHPEMITLIPMAFSEMMRYEKRALLAEALGCYDDAVVVQ